MKEEKKLDLSLYITELPGSWLPLEPFVFSMVALTTAEHGKSVNIRKLTESVREVLKRNSKEYDERIGTDGITRVLGFGIKTELFASYPFSDMDFAECSIGIQFQALSERFLKRGEAGSYIEPAFYHILYRGKNRYRFSHGMPDESVDFAMKAITTTDINNFLFEEFDVYINVNCVLVGKGEMGFISNACLFEGSELLEGLEGLHIQKSNGCVMVYTECSFESPIGAFSYMAGKFLSVLERKLS